MEKSKSFNNKFLKAIVIFLLSVIGVIGLNFSVKKDMSFLDMFFGKNNLSNIYQDNEALKSNYSGLALAGIFEFISLIVIIKENFKIENKRIKRYVFVLSLLLAFFSIIGNSIMLYSTIKTIYKYFFEYLIKFISLTIVLYNLLMVVFNYVINFSKVNYEEKKYFTHNIKSFFIVFILLILAWMPYLLTHFPGTLSFDANTQLKQITGELRFDLSQTFLHTKFVQFCMILGKIFGSMNSGIAIYVILQFIIMSAILSFTLYYLAVKNIDIRIRFMMLVFFAFFPLISIMNIAIVKDTMFSGLFLLLLIILFELMMNTEKFFKSKLRILFSAFITIIFAFSRNNSYYIVISLFPILLLYIIFNSKQYSCYRFKIISFYSIILLLIIIINCVLSNTFEKSKSKEEYSIEMQYGTMIQQVVRATIDNEAIMNKEDVKKIKEFYNGKEDLSEVYCSYLGDRARGMKFINRPYFKEHKIEFLKLYLKMLTEYPISCVDAVLCLTSGYFDIEETRVSLWTESVPNTFDIKNKPIYESRIVKFIEKIIDHQNIPLIGLIFSTSLPVWILISLLFLNLYNKRYDLILLILPLFIYFGTIILGPLNGEIRYVFYLYICLPFVIALSLNETKKPTIN